MKTFSTEIGGKTLTIETGMYAQQANGSCTVRLGDTVVLATAVISSKIRDGIDYFPLLVDYEERLYAAGKIKGSRFIKREGRPTDEAILTSRLVDRSIRPLFDQSQRNDVQAVVTVLSVDQENDPDILSLVAASCALHISSIPWDGPVAGVRIGQINGEWVLNPSYEAREKSVLDLFIVGTKEKIMMIEAGSAEVSEQVMADAFAMGQKHLRPLISLIEEVRASVGKEKMTRPEPNEEERAALAKLEEKVRALVGNRVRDILLAPNNTERERKRNELMKELDDTLKADNDVSKELRQKAPDMVEKHFEHAARELVLRDHRRVDGRALDEIRPLSAAVGVLPRTHGSGVFNRGETQVLSIVTLGSPGDEQVLDTMEESGKKRYMHHYNFPGFSVGEVAPIRGPGRREIGHGALAEKALLPVLPPKEDFPYTMRVVSEVLSSNGSTSQASISGSSLALMDAGVPISRPVTGIAMGLVTDEKGAAEILTDIQGIEDHAYDMDFKVAGTTTGITAIQVDVKIAGITLEIAQKALAGARTAREKILKVITDVIPAPRPDLSPYAPRITMIRIDPEKIREVIGRGGETINKIIDECGGRDVTKIDIEDDGLVMVTSHNAEMAKKALTWIEQLTRDIAVGEVFEGTVSQIVKDRMSGKEIGAIVDLVPGKDGMVHISQLSTQHVENVSSVVKIGDTLKVKVVEVDKERGRISLSVRALTEEYVPHERPNHGGMHNRRGGFSRDRSRR